MTFVLCRYLEEPVLSFDDQQGGEEEVVRDVRKGRQLKQLIDFDLPEDVKLYAGHVFHSPPHRHGTR